MVRAPSPFDPHAVSSLPRVVACLLTGHRPAPLRNRSSQLCRFTNSSSVKNSRLELNDPEIPSIP